MAPNNLDELNKLASKLDYQDSKGKKDTEGNDMKTSEMSMEDFKRLGRIIDSFTERGVSEIPPKFVIVTGGIGSGKTTLRRKKYATSYVHFEYGEILSAIEKEFGEDNPKLYSYAELASDMILRESLEKKKNIVIEIVGENEDVLVSLTRGMKEIGYNNSLNYVDCDPIEGYRRHLKAVKEDPEYSSIYFSQEATLSFFYQQLGLGKMPILSQK